MSELKIGMSATEWAREHGLHYQWSCALDNYEPSPRSWAAGAAYRFIGHNGEEQWLIDDARGLKDYTNAVYLLDDGFSVTATYVIGWHPQQDYVMVQGFPTNYDEEGQRRFRADDNRPVNFSGWQLGPRRAYHLKIQQLTEE